MHAGHLCEFAHRRELASTLDRIARLATANEGPRVTAPVSRSAVRRCRSELTTVVERLVDHDPVGVQGVARIRKLLADGAGPLYGRSSPDRLRRELLMALEGLDLLA